MHSLVLRLATADCCNANAGYALTIFIPMAFFCIFPFEVMRWVLVGLATATSGLFIMANLRAPIFENAGPKCVLHLLLSHLSGRSFSWRRMKRTSGLSSVANLQTAVLGKAAFV